MHETDFSFSDITAPPEGVPKAHGRHSIHGWIMPKPRHHIVDVRARVGDNVFFGVHGFPNSELAQHFQTRGPVALAEFFIVVELIPDHSKIVLEALEIHGTWSHFYSYPYEIDTQMEIAEVETPTGSLRWHEFGRALRWLLRARSSRSTESLRNLADDLVQQLPYPRDQRQPHLPFHGYLEESAAIANNRFGQTPIHGYLFHETQAIKRVLGTYDLQAWQEIDFKQSSPDVAALFPQFPSAEKCGLFGVLDTPAQLPNPAALRIYAELADGSYHLCCVRRSFLYDAESEKTLFPKWSPFTFLRTVWALKSCLKRKGVVLENLAEIKEETQKVRSEYKQQTCVRNTPHPLVIPDAPVNRSPGKLCSVLLFTHNLGIEGAPLLFWEYACSLAKDPDTHLTLISTEDGPLRERYEQIGAQIKIVNIDRLCDARNESEWDDALQILSQQCNLSEANLIIANTISCYWGVHLANQAKKASLFYIHESTPPNVFLATVLKRGSLAKIEQAFRLATRVSFNTQYTSRYYEHLTNRENYWHNPGWIDLRAIDKHREQHSKSALRSNLSLTDDKHLIVNLGTLCDRKGQHIFARAVDLLWRQNPILAAQCEFLMIGGRNSTYDAAMTDLLDKLGHSNLRIIPATDQPYDHLGAADLFVCTSYEESFPRVVLEAMAMETPIISTNVHGIQEMVRDGKEARLVPPGDSSLLAEAMLESLENLGTSISTTQRARARVEENYDSFKLLPIQRGIAFEVLKEHEAQMK